MNTQKENPLYAIDDWCCVTGVLGPRLVGDCPSHPVQKNGGPLVTGTIVAIEGDIAIGNRSNYKLGAERVPGERERLKRMVEAKVEE